MKNANERAITFYPRKIWLIIKICCRTRKIAMQGGLARRGNPLHNP